jgi:hypothetical protein
MRISDLLPGLAALLAAGAAAGAEPGAGALRFAPVPGLERAEGASALAADAPRGRLAVGDARGVWLREGDGRVRRALGSGPVHDLVFLPDGALLAATARGLYEIGADARVRRRALGPGAAGRARRVLPTPAGLFVATDAGIYAAAPGAELRPLDGALPGGETGALAFAAEGGGTGTLFAIVAGDLFAARVENGATGLRAASVARVPLAGAGGPPLDLTAAPLALLRRGALALREDGGFAAFPLALPPGLEPLRLGFGAGRLWIASDGGLLAADAAAGPWRRAEAPLGSAPVSALCATPARVYVATTRGVFASETATQQAGSALARREPLAEQAVGPEPTVQDVQRAALRYLELGSDRLRRLQTRVAKRGLLPELTLHGDYGGFRARDEDHDDTVFASGGRFQLLDRLSERGRDFEVGAQLRWDLGDTVYNPEEIDVSRELRELIELRDEVLDEVNQLYFERRRILLERALLPDPRSPEAERLALRARELAAGLDAWTGGWWSAQARDDSPRATEEERP